MPNQSILFISTVTGWESCEELWSQAATHLSRDGYDVTASVIKTDPVEPRLEQLKAEGIDVKMRPARQSLSKRAWHYLFARGRTKDVIELEKTLRRRSPRLVVISEGLIYPP